ncbi:hypothetical protein QVD99_006566 [Batrachochytrium dendrobatidis]|nr:hypothetical protein QVD99_006566 [Batrachochytrium dendrobatidis]
MDNYKPLNHTTDGLTSTLDTDFDDTCYQRLHSTQNTASSQTDRQQKLDQLLLPLHSTYTQSNEGASKSADPRLQPSLELPQPLSKGWLLAAVQETTSFNPSNHAFLSNSPDINKSLHASNDSDIGNCSTISNNEQISMSSNHSINACDRTASHGQHLLADPSKAIGTRRSSTGGSGASTTNMLQPTTTMQHSPLRTRSSDQSAGYPVSQSYENRVLYNGSSFKEDRQATRQSFPGPSISELDSIQLTDIPAWMLDQPNSSAIHEQNQPGNIAIPPTSPTLDHPIQRTRRRSSKTHEASATQSTRPSRKSFSSHQFNDPHNHSSPNLNSFPTQHHAPPQLNDHTFVSKKALRMNSAPYEHPDPLKRSLMLALQLSDEAVRADNQQLHKLALERYLIVIGNLTDILVCVSQVERLLRAPCTRPHRRRATQDLGLNKTSSFGGILQTSQTTEKSLWSVSADDKHAIMHIRDQYIARVNTLIATLPIDVTTSYSHPLVKPPFAAIPVSLDPPSHSPSFEIAFLNVMRQDLSHTSVPDPLLNDPLLRPLQIMQRLAKSMSHGGFLTNHLYVPSDVWTQPRGKIAFIDMKCNTFNQLFVPLDRLRAAQQNDPEISSISNFNKAVEEYEFAIDVVRTQLLKKLKYLSSDDDGRSSSMFLDSHASHSTLDPSTTQPNPSRDRLLSWSHKFQKSLEKFKSVKERGSSGSSKSISATTTSNSTSSNPSGILSISTNNISMASASSTLNAGASKGSASLLVYSETMSRFLNESRQILLQWVERVTTLAQTTDSDPTNPISPNSKHAQYPPLSVQDTYHVRSKLRKIMQFYDSVVCAMLLKDLHGLLDRFINKICKVANA